MRGTGHETFGATGKFDSPDARFEQLAPSVRVLAPGHEVDPAEDGWDARPWATES